MKKQLLFLLLVVVLLSSCATATLSEFPGVGRSGRQPDGQCVRCGPGEHGIHLEVHQQLFHGTDRCGLRRSGLHTGVSFIY